MMHWILREHFLVENSRHVVAERLVEGAERKHFDLDSRYDQASHIPSKKVLTRLEN